MTSQQILQSDFLDILFEKRNKMYGAYFLRRHYNEHLVKALGITASLLLVLFFFAGSSSKESTTAFEGPPDLNVTAVVIPPDLQPELPKPKVQPAASPKVATVEYMNKIEIVDVSTKPFTTQDALSLAVAGSENTTGKPATSLYQPPVEPSIGEGTSKVEAPPVKEQLPSRQPQFPGGAKAWLHFLNTHLQAPQELEAGEKRTVHIRFSVDEEGTITNFQVVQSGGSSFDQEVIRVLKKMPKWLPAIQNGQPVAVSFTQPVTFFGQEE